MAQSPTHKFGQIIGELLEKVLIPPLSEVADRHGLFLDYKHARAARNNRKKVQWTDSKGNTHDLDYVLEYGGSETTIGSPKAFIESAWRRYTKHSRNKAQEIHGAVSVLAETYQDFNPFLGVVLAGVFTDGSIQQLRSHGYSIVYCSYSMMIHAFAEVGIDASFDEDSKDSDVEAKVDQFKKLTETQHAKLHAELRSGLKNDLDAFIVDLEASLTRKIERIFVATLYGATYEMVTVEQATKFISEYAETTTNGEFVRYEVGVRYTNGDQISGQFGGRTEAVLFLRGLV